MSVVNQMLRDLDRRQAGADHRVYAQRLRPVDGPHRGRWIALGIGIAVLAACGAAYYALGARKASVATAAPTPAAAAAPAQLVAAAPAAVAAPAPSVAPAPQQSLSGPSGAADVAAARQPTPAPPVEQVRREPPSAAQRAGVSRGKRAGISSAPASVRNEPAPAPAAVAPESAAASAPSRTDPAAVGAAPAAPVPPVASAPAPEPSAPKIDKRFRDDAPSAESEFRRAVVLLDRGRLAESRAALRASLALEPRYEGARQTLAALLIEAGETEAAEQLLEEGLRLNPAQANFAIVVARLRVDRGDAAGALAVLRDHGAAAAAVPEYRAFVGAVLRRLGRHAEAIDEYEAALKLAPRVGAWWIGLGLAQEAAERPKEAAEAFRRAKASGTLSPDLAQFVDRKLAVAAR